jgi:hypothetical protein
VDERNMKPLLPQPCRNNTLINKKTAEVKRELCHLFIVS